ANQPRCSIVQSREPQLEAAGWYVLGGGGDALTQGQGAQTEDGRGQDCSLHYALPVESRCQIVSPGFPGSPTTLLRSKTRICAVRYADQPCAYSTDGQHCRQVDRGRAEHVVKERHFSGNERTRATITYRVRPGHFLLGRACNLPGRRPRCSFPGQVLEWAPERHQEICHELQGPHRGRRRLPSARVLGDG